MTRIALILLLLCATVHARTPKVVPLSAPVDTATLETSTGSVTLTAEQKAEVDHWLTDLQQTNAANKAIIAEQKANLDAAQSEITAGLQHTQLVVTSLGEAKSQVGTLQSAIDAQTRQLGIVTDALNKSIAETAKYKKESDRRGNFIGWLGGIAGALLLSHLLFLVPAPYKAIGVFLLPIVGLPIGYFLARFLI